MCHTHLSTKMIRIPIRMTTFGQYMMATQQERNAVIMHIHSKITYLTAVNNYNINLLNNKDVIEWLFGNIEYLENQIKDDIKTKGKRMDALKVLEDKWGQETLRKIRPDLKLDKQWTNRFGEYICQDLYTLQGHTVTKPECKNHYQPDWMTQTDIVEAKAQTHFTSGTAGEKILGTPFKYAEVPRLYNKPLTIVCMGGAEAICRNCYGNLMGDKISSEKQAILDFYKNDMKIKYIGATDILLNLD